MPLYIEIGGGSRCLQHAPQDAQPSGGESGTLVSTSKLTAESRYQNPDPLLWLLGHANEAVVVVVAMGVEMTALVILGPKSLPSLKDPAQKWG